jgi:hypothetical protein
MKCQVLEELEKDGFKGNILSIEHLSTLESFQVVEQIVFISMGYHIPGDKVQSVAEKGFKKVGLLIKL